MATLGEKTFKLYAPKQSFLLPPSMDDWLPPDHLARFVSEMLDDLDLSPIFDYYDETRGQPPYHPMMMTKVIVYGYCVGVRSSRKLAQAVEDQVAFRYLAAGNMPAHNTVSEFRRIHLASLEDLFDQVLQTTAKSGLLRLGTVTIDGTKIQGNASLEATKTHRDLRKEDQSLREVARKILEDAERIDREEDALYGPENTPYGLPKELADAKTRRAVIRKAIEDMRRENRERVEREQREYEEHVAKRERQEQESGKKLRGRKPKPPVKRIDPQTKRNTTDVDSRIMKTRNGYVQGYNAQVVVDTETLLIVGRAVAKEENDTQQSVPMLEQVRESAGQYPAKAVYDAGYWNEAMLRTAPGEVDLYVATVKDHKQRRALREAPPPVGRIPKNLTLKQRMERKLRTKNGKETYALRSQTVEPRFGIIKEQQGVRRFLLRGLEKVRGEWGLVTLAHNLNRLWRIEASMG